MRNKFCYIALGNEKKSKLLFFISLVFSYLCTRKKFNKQ